MIKVPSFDVQKMGLFGWMGGCGFENTVLPVIGWGFQHGDSAECWLYSHCANA